LKWLSLAGKRTHDLTTFGTKGSGSRITSAGRNE